MQCNPRKDGPCGNCLRRYPPVECYVKPDPRAAKQVPIGIHPTSLAAGLRTTLPPIVPTGSSKSSASEEQHTLLPSISLDPRIQDNQPHQTPILDQVSRAEKSAVQSTQSTEQTADLISSNLHTHSSIFKNNTKPTTSASSSSVVLLKAPSHIGSPRPFGGALTAINTLNGVPIEPTIRNAELFHFCEFITSLWIILTAHSSRICCSKPRFGGWQEHTHSLPARNVALDDPITAHAKHRDPNGFRDTGRAWA